LRGDINTKSQSENLLDRKYVGDSGVEGRIISKFILKEEDVWLWGPNSSVWA
jgi:hypothetical protein